MIELTDHPELAADQYLLARDMAETLHAQFPGYLWAVHVGDGIASVRLMNVSGNWGFVLKLAKRFSASDWKQQVTRAGGEILERFRLKTGRADPSQLAAMSYDFGGRAVGDYAK